MSVSTEYPIGYEAYKRDSIIRAAIDKRAKTCESREAAKSMKNSLIALVQHHVYLGWRMPSEVQDANLIAHWLSLLGVEPSDIAHLTND